MIEELLRESFARHEAQAPATETLRRGIDALATRRRHRRTAVLTGGVAATVAVLLVAVTVIVRQLAPVVGNLPTVPLPGHVPDRALNILLLGLDTRPEFPPPYRSDIVSVVHVSEDRNHVYLVDIPRDLLVDIPGHGEDKLSSAHAFGGPQLSATVVENLTGLELDGTVTVDLGALRELADILGPVPVCLPFSMSVSTDGRTFEPGCYTLDSDDVVDIARERYNVPMGAISRAANVQRILVGFAEQAASLDLLGDADQLAALLAIDGITIDLPDIDPVALAAQLRGVAAADIVGIADPFHGAADRIVLLPSGASVMLLDQQVAPQLFSALHDETLADFVAAHPDWVSTSVLG